MYDMKKITQEEFDEIVRKHNLWLDGMEGERAVFSRVDLSNIKCDDIVLDYAIFNDCQLNRCEFISTKFCNVIFNDAFVYGSCFDCCDFTKSLWYDTNIYKTIARGCIFDDGCFYKNEISFGSTIVYCSFYNATLKDIVLESVSIQVKDIDFFIKYKDKLRLPWIIEGFYDKLLTGKRVNFEDWKDDVSFEDIANLRPFVRDIHYIVKITMWYTCIIDNVMLFKKK